MLIFGFPIAIMLYTLFRRSNTSFLLATYILAIGGTMIVATAVFSASVGSTGSDDLSYRLHMRYYNFIYPLLLVLIASVESPGFATKIAVTIALPIAGIAVYVGIFGIAPFTPNFIDSPFVRGTTRSATDTIAMALATCALIALWLRNSFLSRRLALFLVYPVAFMVAWQSINRDLVSRTYDGEYDRAGKILNLVSSENSRIYIYGDKYASLFRAAFYAQRRFIKVNPEIDKGADIVAFIDKKPTLDAKLIYSDEHIVIMRTTDNPK
jgi:phosphoglycerol transferase